ncbi:MAG: hypothetical protein ACKPA7_33280, partial [Sphaerospermopsis kisseleviana]
YDSLENNPREWYCLNQNVQDLRIFRMLFDDCWLLLKDFFCLNQDVQDLRIYRMLFDDGWLRTSHGRMNRKERKGKRF